MSNEIKPALTPDEWQIVGKSGTIYREGIEIGILGALCMVAYPSDGRAVSLGDDAAPTLIAILNENLDGGHPLKITREDVALLRYLADYHRTLTRFEDVYEPEPRIARLAIKLSALLPPEA